MDHRCGPHLRQANTRTGTCPCSRVDSSGPPAEPDASCIGLVQGNRPFLKGTNTSAMEAGHYFSQELLFAVLKHLPSLNTSPAKKETGPPLMNCTWSAVKAGRRETDLPSALLFSEMMSLTTRG